ncbi:class I SAM-dependent methyltransferase [Sinomonas sp. ASV486]|uniref:class I SAM-dependent methyltransferase n=1 Tax=Sinomonas sp. ASV486 TaxID=3051170 RepID=UPI0027DD9155|nr:class I SAM-dependent methyltransferase [Sinomonas sp. ASV486]MDQ4488886.1 class I SAM-dependent methyltransferase [Sinomonas sp. ASV486]
MAQDNTAPEQLAPLLTPEGWALLNSLGPYREEDALALTTRMRKAGHSPELVAAVLSQARLRVRAEAKFGEFAGSMLFTRAGLEQATRLSVAARHARRFVDAGVRHVADLGCGLGADAMAMASLDLEVTAVELDETTAACATMNLMPFPHARVVHADAQSVPLDGVDGVWLDPARRETSTSGTTRLWDPEAFSPPLSFVEGLARHGLPVGVKLGPGTPHESIPAGCEAQWVSVNGDVAEVALYFNALRRPSVRRAALVLTPDGAAELVAETDFGGGTEPRIGALGGFLYEPDGAVIRAELVAELAERLGGHLVDPHIAYICSPELLSTPFAKAYRVLEVRPYNVKALRAWVREEAIGVLDIKKRGASVTPEELRRLLLSGQRKGASKRATLVLTRIGDERVAAVVEPV